MPRSADRVYDQVKLMAVTYRLRPGDRINEAELARQLGVSRTPLREALNRLAAEGFLTAASRGYVVRALDPKRVLTLYEYRTMLETTALRLVSERASDQAIAELLAFAEHSRDRPDDDVHALSLLALDEEFHERIAALSGNEEIERSLRSLNERIRFVRWIDMRKGRRSSTQAEHVSIVHHLQGRDAEGAATLMRAHIARRLDQIVETIRLGYAEIYTGNLLAAHAMGEE